MQARYMMIPMIALALLLPSLWVVNEDYTYSAFRFVRGLLILVAYPFIVSKAFDVPLSVPVTVELVTLAMKGLVFLYYG